eukprot:SAG31_NODE_13934_length_836_cov_3.358209_1_plen_175_part_00
MRITPFEKPTGQARARPTAMIKLKASDAEAVEIQLPPITAAPRGRPRKVRVDALVHSKKKRFCSRCQKYVDDHDARTCQGISEVPASLQQHRNRRPPTEEEICGANTSITTDFLEMPDCDFLEMPEMPDCAVVPITRQRDQQVSTRRSTRKRTVTEAGADYQAQTQSLQSKRRR